MNRRPRQKLTFTMMIFLMSVSVLMSSVSCGPRLQGIKVLSTPPYDQTLHSAYPTIKKIYQSDDELFFVSTWQVGGKPEDHRIRWEICTLEGESIYTSSEEHVTIRRRMSYYQPIQLDKNVKKRLQSGMCTVKLYFDDELKKSQDVEYISKSIINPNLNGAVLLPFRFKTASYVQEKTVLNTVTNAIYGEVKRIIKDTVPPSAAEEGMPYKFDPKFYDDEKEMARIKKIFQKDIFLTGSLELGQYKIDRMALTVSVYDARKGHIRKFGYQTLASANYDTTILDLIEGILYKENLLEYLGTL